nr:MAG TPA: hypothetical protein [Caudoviricetes sp.]
MHLLICVHDAHIRVHLVLLHYTPINFKLQHNLVRFAKIAVNFAHDCVYNANRT